MADCAQMNANLVGTTRVDRHMSERQRRIQALGAGDPGDGLATAARACRHFFPVRWIAPDWCVDSTAGLHLPPHERDVLLLDLALAKLPSELFMGRVMLGDDHQSRGAAVEAMHDAGTLFAANAAEIIDVV